MRMRSGHDAERVGTWCGRGRRMVRNVAVHDATPVGCFAPADRGGLAPIIMGDAWSGGWCHFKSPFHRELDALREGALPIT